MSLHGAPLLEQNCRRVFVAKQGSHGLFERATEQHGGACVFFLPAIEVAVTVTPRTRQILADLRVAVVHRCSLPPRSLKREALETGAADSSSHWLAGANPSRLISEMPLITVWLILTIARRVRAERVHRPRSWAQQFRIVEEIPQEPTQLPHRLRSAVQTAHDGLPGRGSGSRMESRST